jgi:hypothetical protein
MPHIPLMHANLIAQFSGAAGQHECQNAVGFVLSTTPTGADVDAACNALSSVYGAQLNSASRFHGLRCVYDDGGGLQEIHSVNGAANGARSSALAAPQAQGLIQKRSGLIGRAHRGRLFIPDMAEAQVGDDGTISAGGLTLLDDIGAAWASISALGSFGSACILHRGPSPVPDLCGFFTSSKVATLRGRYER